MLPFGSNLAFPCRYMTYQHQKTRATKKHKGDDAELRDEGTILKFLNAAHSLRFLLRIHKAAKGSLKLLPARPMCHTSQARAVPVDLSCLWIKRALLIRFLLQLLRRRRRRLPYRMIYIVSFPTAELFPRSGAVGSACFVGSDEFGVVKCRVVSRSSEVFVVVVKVRYERLWG